MQSLNTLADVVKYSEKDCIRSAGRKHGIDTDGQHIYISWDETKCEIWVMDVIR